MKIQVQAEYRRNDEQSATFQTLVSDTQEGVSIGIPLEFQGLQPNHFGTPPATTQPLKLDSFLGDTRQGGSCNVSQVQLIPHCNGTHTETVGHIVHDSVSISDIVPNRLLLADLISVRPQRADAFAQSTGEDYRPPLEPEDLVITRRDLAIFETTRAYKSEALVIRTLPNEVEKRSRKYGPQCQPPFLTRQAMETLLDWGIEHLLVDFPSVDRMYDDGLLSNHHEFWRIPQESHNLGVDCARHRTISEMVYVPDEVRDGNYLLSLQVPGWGIDAAPSRPILYPLRPIEEA